MEIKNTKEYLEYRMQILKKEHEELIKQIDELKIQIRGIRERVSNIINNVDEAFEMFSPIAAQEKSFNEQEVKELQMRLFLYKDEKESLESKDDEIIDEMHLIKKLLESENMEDK